MKQKLLFALGYRFVASKRSKDVHSIENGEKCLQYMKEHNKVYLTRRGVTKYLKEGFRLCPNCMKHFNP